MFIMEPEGARSSRVFVAKTQRSKYDSTKNEGRLAACLGISVPECIHDLLHAVYRMFLQQRAWPGEPALGSGPLELQIGRWAHPQGRAKRC